MSSNNVVVAGSFTARTLVFHGKWASSAGRLGRPEDGGGDGNKDF